MPDLIKPLSHADADKKSDEVLAQECVDHIVKNPSLQLITELLTKLREMEMPWWTPKHLRATYSSTDRLRWMSDRPDLRQRITTTLTGLAPRAARKKAPDFQAGLIDSCIDDGDILVDDFEVVFEPSDMVVYGPAGDYWRLFRRRMPWDDDATAHQDLIGWLIGALLSDKSIIDGAPRKPVLDAWDVRTAIDGRVWHSRVPLDVRVAIDDARLKQQRENPGEPFHADGDLVIAAPALIAASIPLKDLIGVLDVAGRALGFEGEGDHGSLRPSAAPEPGRASVIPPRESSAPSYGATRDSASPAPTPETEASDDPSIEASETSSVETSLAALEEDEMDRTSPGTIPSLDDLDMNAVSQPPPGMDARSRKEKRRR